MHVEVTARESRTLVSVVGLTLFLSAFLLFLCQPMVGKMVLPYLGGAAAAWTTCVLFFQVALLGGYIYAHALGRTANVRAQIAVHAVVLLLTLAFLPIEFAGGRDAVAFTHPTAWLLSRLIGTVGVPFLVISTTAPLLQNWVSATFDLSAQDPYFLYAASNAGSFLALFAYPFVVEPRIGAVSQSRLWLLGYCVLIVMIAASVTLIWNRRAIDPSFANNDQARPDMRGRLYWIAASFTASGLMLAVTNHISSNLASAPFLWIIPLAIYLLTFIQAFARRVSISPELMWRVTPFVLLALFPFPSAEIVARPGLNWILIGAHLLLLYAGALQCHTALAGSRPHPHYLTEFYFWLALGGVLGGIFTATLAPMIFKTILEYPVLVGVVAFLRVRREDVLQARRSDYVYPLLVAAAAATAWFIFRKTEIDSDKTVPALAHTVFLFVGYRFRRRPLRFALTVAVLVATYTMVMPHYLEGVERAYVTRNFFGVKKVLQYGTFRELRHGDTTHGLENTDPDFEGQPISYYHSSGTVGNVMAVPLRHVAVVGLGTGTMAAYAKSDRHVTFYDVDPQVESIARKYFTFLPKCGSNCDVVIGDGRLELERASDGEYDLIMLDAFSSDAVPAHLVSREALRLYLKKLAPNGILLFHVSNRYLKVDQLVSALTYDAGLATFQRYDDAGEQRSEGRNSTNHVMAVRSIDAISRVPNISEWTRVSTAPGVRVWTDDYSSILQIVRWR
jgi:SAM-dependent methyltransferase